MVKLIRYPPERGSASPIPVGIEVKLTSAALLIEPDHKRDLIAISLAADRRVKVLISAESAWWLSLALARATKELQGDRS